MNTCVIDGTQSQCECMLEELEERMSIDQFIVVEQVYLNNGDLPNAFLEAANAC